MDLERSYRYEGAVYGPGKGLEVPDDIAKKIRSFQKEFEKEDDGGQE